MVKINCDEDVIMLQIRTLQMFSTRLVWVMKYLGRTHIRGYGGFVEKEES